MTRETTNKLLEMIESGALDAATVARDALGWMSEDEVKDFAARNDYLADEDEFEFADEDDVREAFAEHWAECLRQNPDLGNDEPAKRETFSVFIDGLHREGRMSDDLVNSVTLED